jgi:hypothetical protein|tara:strand:- start:4726 stop:4938 length:213 start_codon:yes stop_codon:yes gene_type:complete
MSKTKLVRMDRDVERKLKDIMQERYDKKLAKLNIRELSPAEAMRLIMRAPSFPQVESEVRTLPKGRKNGK